MKWIQLKRGSGGIYRLEANNNNEDSGGVSRSLNGGNFSQVAFDDTEEQLVASDTRGYVYQFEFRGFNDITYKKFEKFPAPTCLAFNPLVRSEIIFGLTTNAVIVRKLGAKSSFVQLSSHRYPVAQITFYKDYCLTASSKEAIIWDLRTCAKTHQLRLDCASADLKKAAFSNCGHIAALYTNDSLQIWSYEGLNEESRISLRNYGLHNVKDFIFTRDGRAIIVCAAKGGIRVFDTARFELTKSFDIHKGLSIPKRISIVPHPLDAGVAKMLAIHCTDGSVKFFDLSGGKFVEVKEGTWKGIRKFVVSPQGRWITWTEVNGSLCFCRVDGLFSGDEEAPRKKNEVISRHGKGHRTQDHLNSIKREMREELGLTRLLPILQEYGEYPAKHRIVIWSTIMELPVNREACTGLNDNVAHNALIRDMLAEYPLEDRCKASLLATTVDRLVKWSSLLGQCQFLPALVFPFLVVFQKNRLLALEASITILTNFCQKWFEYYPLPPLNILGIVENILLESDPSLLTCFCERGVTSSDYAWPLLRTTMSEVLTADEWLVLWDHILSYRRPSFLIMCVVAYSICCRETIVSLLRKPEDFRQFYSTRGNISVKKLIRVAKGLDRNTPERIHPLRYLRNDFIVLPNEGPYPPFLMHEYPNFLVEEESGLARLGALKEEEKVLEEYRRKAMIVADEKRRRDEMENFVKGVHRDRMSELRKCYDEQVRMTRFNVENTRDEILRYESTFGESTSRSLGRGDNAVIGKNFRNRPNNNYKELRNQVQDLESQVQRFLGALHKRPSDNVS